MERKQLERMREEEIVRTVQRMKIIVKNGSNSHYLRHLTKFEILRKPLTWFDKPTDIEEKVDYSTLKEITEVEIKHEAGLYGFFTPFIPEIIDGIPTDILNEVYAFEMSLEPIKNPNDKCYKSKVKLYKKI